jgi:microcystin-dependent protein
VGHGVDRNETADGSGAAVTPVQLTLFTAKGDLAAGTANGAVDNLAVGANETRLVADSTQTTGLKYVADTTNYAVAAKGDLLVGTAADTVAPLTVGANDYVLTADSAQDAGMKWAHPFPSGMVVPYAGATEPTGWLFCYGQAVSRSTYAGLFTAISTTYGTGDGSTTFNLPDLRGRVVAGQDDMGGSSANRLTNQTGGLDGDTLGATGGAETHTLTIAQMPAHTHTMDIQATNLDDLQSPTQNMIAGGSTATSSTGGDGAHNNVQPTIILNYIIKT